MIHFLLDLLFPRHSFTGREGELVTVEELRALRSVPVILEQSVLRSRGLESIDRVVAAAEYDTVPLLHKAVHAFKYRKVREVGEVLGVEREAVLVLLGR